MNGEESGETVKKRTEVEENKKKLNENYEDEAGETQNVDQEEEKELIHLNGKNNEENSKGIEHSKYQDDVHPEEEIKEDSVSQNQVSVYSFKLFSLWYCSSFISALCFSSGL